jgi:ClpP class serine protease
VLHTPGGLVLAATQIARAVLKRKGKVTVFVPHYAMSGGTLIALAAKEIVMSGDAVLGPVDPQLGQQPAASILKALRQKPIAEVDDQTLILADQAGKAVAQMEQEVGELLADKYPAEQAEELAKLMIGGTWTHDYPITYERARALGLRVDDKIPENMLHLMQLYPQPTRRQPSGRVSADSLSIRPFHGQAFELTNKKKEAPDRPQAGARGRSKAHTPVAVHPGQKA